mmetsp:Transcript_66433/g.163767  ORF Transcript_66433/g.163767 Transcript_66433/m.163767 type:complete len:505 (+) Transcript_66433:635-2149(+)
MEAPNLKVIKVREAEAQEKEGKRSTCMNGVMGAAGKPLVNAPDRLRSGCALSDDCEYEMLCNFQEKTDDWKVTKYVGHSCDEICKVEQRKPSCAYSTDMLVDASKHLVNGINGLDTPVTPRLVRNHLSQFIRLDPPISLATTVKEKAQLQLRGKAQAMAARIPALAEEARKLGHFVKDVTCQGLQMRKNIVDRMQADHTYEQDRLPEGHERTPFDRDAAEAAALEVVPDPLAIYIYAVTIIPSTMLETLECYHAVDQNDGMHMHSETHGVNLVTIALDADHHIAPIATTFVIDNERYQTWNLHNEAIQKAYGKERFDTWDRRRIIDAAKGEIASMEDFLADGSWFACTWHRSKGVKKYFGVQGKEEYWAAVLSNTEEQLGVNKAVMGEPLKAYLSQVPDKNQYMFSAGQLHGFSAESSAEAYHQSNESIRKQHLYGAASKWFELSRARYNKNRKRAHSCTSRIPPAVKVCACAQVTARSLNGFLNATLPPRTTETSGGAHRQVT